MCRRQKSPPSRAMCLCNLRPRSPEKSRWVQVRANARALGDRLMSYGYKLVTDGTDNHLVLWDLRKEVSWLEQAPVGPCLCHLFEKKGLPCRSRQISPSCLSINTCKLGCSGCVGHSHCCLCPLNW